MTIDELTRSYEGQIATNRSKQETAEREINLILNDAKRQGRGSLSEDESARSDRLFRDMEAAKNAGRDAEAKLTRARAVAAEEAEIDARSRQTRASGAPRPAYDDVLRIGAEKRDFNRGNDPRGSEFAQTVYLGANHG